MKIPVISGAGQRAHSISVCYRHILSLALSRFLDQSDEKIVDFLNLLCVFVCTRKGLGER